MIKTLPALFATGILCITLTACGNTNSGTAPQDASNAAATLKTNSTHKNDRDNDQDNNDDDQHTLAFGHPADAADKRAITTLLSRYFAAAAAGDGTSACKMLTPFIAETVAETEGHTPELQGKTCAVVMTKLFKHHHTELLGKSTNLKIIRIGIEGNKSIVALDFPEIHEIRQISIRHTHNKWTILHLLDGIIE